MNKKRILLVDDDERVLETYKRILEKAGYIVDAASDGKQTIEKLNNTAYDLVLLDIVLPDISGDKIVFDLRFTDNTTPVILITGFSEYKQTLDALGLGIEDILLKPIGPADLVNAINEVLLNFELTHSVVNTHAQGAVFLAHEI